MRLIRVRLVVAGLAGILAISALSWMFTAEAHGTPPPGTYDVSSHADWPTTPAGAVDVRRDALAHAAVRVAPDDPYGTAPLRGAHDPLAASPVSCQFVREAPSGTSPKFDCVLGDGDVVKVKYGRNPEIHAETAATRLLRRLGYAADEVTILPRLRCYGCPRLPFLTMRVLAMAGSIDTLSPRGHAEAYTDFEWVSVERRFPAPAIETPAIEGWGWWELGESDAPAADLDAFRLLAVFLAHWDNKASNQRLVCLDAAPPAPDTPCEHPLAMIHDAGATFGPPKANLARWRTLPIWADRETCLVSMWHLPFHGATFPDITISEAGRRQLADRLAGLSDADIRTLFDEARFPDYYRGTDDGRDLDAWTAAFRQRASQIVDAAPCPA